MAINVYCDFCGNKTEICSDFSKSGSGRKIRLDGSKKFIKPGDEDADIKLRADVKLYIKEISDKSMDVCDECWEDFKEKIKEFAAEYSKSVREELMNRMGTEFRLINS